MRSTELPASRGDEGPAHAPQLDGLRGLAMIGVLINHFAHFPGSDYCGWLGVTLFFVLSGFLISRILFTQRRAVEAGLVTRGRALRTFYARRALRIFPAYYLTLAVLWALDFPNARQQCWWLGTYTYNVHQAARGWDPGYPHFWSLCVEEQFYLLWPLVLLACPRRLLVPGLVALPVLAPLWRAGCAWYGAPRTALIVLPPCCLDCLVLGAALAYLEGGGPDRRAARDHFLRFCQVGGGLLLACWLALCCARTPWVWRATPVEALVGNTAMALVFCAVVAAAARRVGGDWGAFLGMRWLRYLGKISYGVYIYHLFTPRLSAWLVPRIPLIEIPGLYMNVVLSLVLAAVSWHLFEQPINRLKDRFRYAPPVPQELAPRAAVLGRAA